MIFISMQFSQMFKVTQDLYLHEVFTGTQGYSWSLSPCNFYRHSRLLMIFISMQFSYFFRLVLFQHNSKYIWRKQTQSHKYYKSFSPNANSCKIPSKKTFSPIIVITRCNFCTDKYFQKSRSDLFTHDVNTCKKVNYVVLTQFFERCLENHFQWPG